MKKFPVYAPVLAVILMLVPLPPLVSSTNAAQSKAESKKSSREQKPGKRVRGEKDMADGQIKSVTCKGRAMNMVFDGSYETLHLFTANYFKVEFSAINFTPHGKMNPCKTAKGMYARVYYYHIKGKPHEGELISVQFRK